MAIYAQKALGQPTGEMEAVARALGADVALALDGILGKRSTPDSVSGF
jgi:hypothetical protein